MKRTIAWKMLTWMLLTWMLLLPIHAFAQPERNESEINMVLEPAELLPTPGPTAETAALVEQRSGKLLFGKDEHKRMYPASTTKILTALIAIEMGDLEETLTVGDEVWMIASDGTKAGLYMNEEITLENLVYGLMINSGNDAGMTIAVHIARKIHGEDLSTREALNKFSEIMNDRAKKAGALDSNFVNPHGYHDPNHYTTAYDLAMIMRAGLSHDFFRTAVSTLFMETQYWTNQEPRYWRSRNRLIDTRDKEYYEYAIGGKTGWTSRSGSCLVSAAARDGQEVVAVVLRSAANQQWKDSRDMLEFGLTNYEYVQLLSEGAIVETLPVENYAPGDWGSLAIAVDGSDFGDTFFKTDIPRIQKAVTWESELLAKPRDAYDTSPRLMAPLHRGQEIGRLTYTLNGQTLASSPLVATRDVQKRTLMDRILPTTPGEADSSPSIWRIVLILAILLIVALRIAAHIQRVRRRRQRALYRRY